MLPRMMCPSCWLPTTEFDINDNTIQQYPPLTLMATLILPMWSCSWYFSHDLPLPLWHQWKMVTPTKSITPPALLCLLQLLFMWLCWFHLSIWFSSESYDLLNNLFDDNENKSFYLSTISPELMLSSTFMHLPWFMSSIVLYTCQISHEFIYFHLSQNFPWICYSTVHNAK